MMITVAVRELRMIIYDYPLVSIHVDGLNETKPRQSDKKDRKEMNNNKRRRPFGSGGEKKVTAS